jgi:AcrR family transcriptional regulator
VAKTTTRTRNREATEQLLINACEKMLLTHGPDGIGVNKVVEEAGVGKQLLYRYFNDLPGLVSAWLDRGANWPTAKELIGDLDAFEQLKFKDKIKSIQHNYLTALRQRPVIMRIMASELMHPTEVTAVLEKSSDRIAKELTKSIKGLNDEQQDDLVNLSFVFYCMLNYLCMRAVTNPKCFGMNLKQEKSWNRIDQVVDDLIDRYLTE